MNDTNSGGDEMHVKIRIGAPICQDHCFGLRWPQCLAPGGGDIADDPEMIFTTRPQGMFSKEGWLSVEAFGYGDLKNKGGYGNGSIFVREIDVEYLDEPAKLSFIGMAI